MVKTPKAKAVPAGSDGGHGQVWVPLKDKIDPPPKSYDEAHEESLLQLERLCDFLAERYPATKGMDVDVAVVEVVNRLEHSLERERRQRQTEGAIRQRQEAPYDFSRQATAATTVRPPDRYGGSALPDLEERVRLMEEQVADLSRTSAAPPPKGNGARPALDSEALKRVEAESTAAVQALFKQMSTLGGGDAAAIQERLAEFERLAKGQGKT